MINMFLEIPDYNYIMILNIWNNLYKVVDDKKLGNRKIPRHFKTLH